LCSNPFVDGLGLKEKMKKEKKEKEEERTRKSEKGENGTTVLSCSVLSSDFIFVADTNKIVGYS
jgi:hypothetical protein